MSSKRNLRRRACDRKVAYPAQADAEATVAAVRRRNNREAIKFTYRNQRLAAYPCPHCGGWHIGHAPKRARR